MDWNAVANTRAREIRSQAERTYMQELDELTELAQGIVDHATMVELASAWNRAARRLMEV